MKLRNICLLGVVAMGLAGCMEKTNPRVTTRLNDEAALVGDLPSNPLSDKVITSWINKKDGTMSTMFGNEVGVQYARTNAEGKYPVGAVLSVVTWGQQEDPRWFGGKIPQKPRWVEIVTVTGPGTFDYARYEGSPLKRVAKEYLGETGARVNYFLEQRAAVMP